MRPRRRRHCPRQAAAAQHAAAAAVSYATAMLRGQEHTAQRLRHGTPATQPLRCTKQQVAISQEAALYNRFTGAAVQNKLVGYSMHGAGRESHLATGHGQPGSLLSGLACFAETLDSFINTLTVRPTSLVQPELAPAEARRSERSSPAELQQGHSSERSPTPLAQQQPLQQRRRQWRLAAGTASMAQPRTTPTELRVVSLLPAATDTVVSLDLTHLLVGRSHEVRYFWRWWGNEPAAEE